MRISRIRDVSGQLTHSKQIAMILMRILGLIKIYWINSLKKTATDFTD
jgi:hypothetical protein